MQEEKREWIWQFCALAAGLLFIALGLWAGAGKRIPAMISPLIESGAGKEEDDGEKEEKSFLSAVIPLLSYYQAEAGETAAGEGKDPAYESYRAGMGSGIMKEDEDAIYEQLKSQGRDDGQTGEENGENQGNADGDASDQGGLGESQGGDGSTQNSGDAGQKTAGDAGTAGEGDTGDGISQSEEPGSAEDGLGLMGLSLDQTGKVYTPEQLADYDFLTKTFYTINADAGASPEILDGDKLASMDMTMKTGADQPQILIYHTHGSEYFADSDPDDPSTLITGVGDYLAEILTNQYGFNVIHDTTVFPYSQSYNLGYVKVKEILEANPSIEVVIDLHRDADNGNKMIREVNGVSMAPIMFFNGISQSKDGPYLDHENPNREENLAFSLQMKLTAEAWYPGFTRKNMIKPYRYNMHMRGKYTLVEAGGESNTLQEVKNAMVPLADILAKVLKGEAGL